MFYFIDGGDRKADELNVYDCRGCGTPTVFPRSGGTGLCATCAGQPAVAAEAARACPVDGTAMVSERRSDVVIDQCPACRGAWLDAGEFGPHRRGQPNRRLRSRPRGRTDPEPPGAAGAAEADAVRRPL